MPVITAVLDYLLSTEEAIVCLICVEFGMSRITIAEAKRNLREMKEVIGEEHLEKVENFLAEKEAERIEDMTGEEFLEEFGDILADGSD